MKMQGKILDIGAKTLSGDQNQYSRQEVTIDCSYEYQGRDIINVLKFQFENKNTEKLANRRQGEEVEVEFEPHGRFYQKDGVHKHFQQLKAWGITVLAQAPAAHASPAVRGAENYPDLQPHSDTKDDLPF